MSGPEQKAYVLILWDEVPLREAETAEIVRAVGIENGCPAQLLGSTQERGSIPTGPDDYVIALALAACQRFGIEFESDRDQIGYRHGEHRPGVTLGLITVVVKGKEKKGEDGEEHRDGDRHVSSCLGRVLA
jgi:hypothetical protein